MREFFQLINEYPWTAICVCVAVLIALDIIFNGLKKK